MANFKVGQVTHFFDKIGVAVVILNGTLSVGDKVRLVRGGEDMFEQVVSSIQVDYQKVSYAKKGDTVGIKFDSPVREGTELYKIS